MNRLFKDRFQLESISLEDISILLSLFSPKPRLEEVATKILRLPQYQVEIPCLIAKFWTYPNVGETLDVFGESQSFSQMCRKLFVIKEEAVIIFFYYFWFWQKVKRVG